MGLHPSTPPPLPERPLRAADVRPEHLRAWRMAHGYTVAALAHAYGLTARQVLAWEAGSAATAPAYRALVWELWEAGLSQLPSRSIMSLTHDSADGTQYTQGTDGRCHQHCGASTMTSISLSDARAIIDTQLGANGEAFYARLGYYAEDAEGRQFAHPAAEWNEIADADHEALGVPRQLVEYGQAAKEAAMELRRNLIDAVSSAERYSVLGVQDALDLCRRVEGEYGDHTATEAVAAKLGFKWIRGRGYEPVSAE